MTTSPVRIAMWSGPRNISTAMMRAFSSRPDTAVVDEPFYAAYLAHTGIDHPLRDEVVASQPTDWREVVAVITGPVPQHRSVFYQKHMTHHMLPAFGLDWLPAMRHAFLIRDPSAVLASYVQKRGHVTLADIGVVQQHELFDREAQRLGHAPPVVEGVDVLANPAATLSKLCTALGIPYTDAMLRWAAGRHASDGVWAPAWYSAVEQSTGFERPSATRPVVLTSELQAIADQARPLYEALARFKLS